MAKRKSTKEQTTIYKTHINSSEIKIITKQKKPTTYCFAF